MRSLFLLICLSICLSTVQAQLSPLETARAFIRQQDYSNAILVLNRAIENDRRDLELRKELSYAYYLKGDLAQAHTTIDAVTGSNDADAHSFQLQGMIQTALGELRDAERTYRTGIKYFPSSGVLYNDYGDLLWKQSDFQDAAKQWLKGIQQAPQYAGNYYHASRYYFMSADKVWAILYGEMFLNLESFSRRTPEIKSLVLEAYKKLFSTTDLAKDQDTRNGFVKAYLDVMQQQSHLLQKGLTPDAISAVRTRFILEWFERYASKYPFRLFEYHRELAGLGLFDAYNQWIFGAAADLAAFQRWTQNHSQSYSRFNELQKSRLFRIPDQQQYHPKP